MLVDWNMLTPFFGWSFSVFIYYVLWRAPSEHPVSTQWARCHLCHQRPGPIFKRMGLRVQHDFRGVSSFCKSWQKLIPANIMTQKNMRKVIWEIFSAMGWNINPGLIKYLFYCYYFLCWINNICSLLITALRAIDIHGIWQPRRSTLTQLQWILPLGCGNATRT